MHHQCIHLDNNKLDCDCSHDILNSNHKFQYMDQYIFGLCMPCHKNIQSWQHIQVDNLVDFQYKLEDMNKQLDYWFHDTESLVRKEMVDKDWHIEEQQLYEMNGYKLWDIM